MSTPSTVRRTGDPIAAVVLAAVPAWLLGLFVGENFDLAPLVVIPLVTLAVVLLVGKWRLNGAVRRGVLGWLALAVPLLVLAAIQRIVAPDGDLVQDVEDSLLRDPAQLAAGAGVGVCLALVLAAANEALFGRALGARHAAVAAVAGATGGALGVATYLFVGFF